MSKTKGNEKQAICHHCNQPYPKWCKQQKYCSAECRQWAAEIRRDEAEKALKAKRE